jgi:hypothetical protein
MGWRDTGYIITLSLIPISSLANAQCPTATLPQFVSCHNPDAIRHILNQHCSHRQGESEFEEYYCNASNLLSACQEATKAANASYPDNCYKKGERGEIVGYLPDHRRTNCYQVNFKNAQGLNMILNTMYPVEQDYCTQH